MVLVSAAAVLAALAGAWLIAHRVSPAGSPAELQLTSADAAGVILVGWLISASAVATTLIAIGVLQHISQLLWRHHERRRPRANVTPTDQPRVQPRQQVKSSTTTSLQPEEPRIPAAVPLFQIRLARSGKLIWSYTTEGAALGFVRDVARLRSHQEAAQFELRIVLHTNGSSMVAEGEQLVRRALEDRIL